LKIDRLLDKLGKRLNLLTGHTPSSKWDNDSNGPIGPSNWDFINAVIKEHPNDGWFIPDEEKINCWSSPVISGLGNIELRDFELERRFADMRHARVEEYDRKWDEALQRNDKDYLDEHPSNITAPTFWTNWSAEELEYYEDVERFPILKDGNYKPNWKLFSINDKKEG
jgi:hypothetical protein